MDWIEMAWTVLGSAGLGGVLIGWLFKRFINHNLKKDLEDFKNDGKKEIEEFKAQSVRELETVKADLRVDAFKREATFSKLNEERAGAIKELYSSIMDVERFSISYFSPLQQGADEHYLQREKEVVDSFSDLLKKFRCNRILFSPKLCDKLVNLIDEWDQAWMDYRAYPMEEKFNDFETLKERRALMKKAWDVASKKIPEIRRDLETDFRKMLGVEHC